MGRNKVALLLSALLMLTPLLSACGGQSSGDSGHAASVDEKVEAPVLDGMWIQEGREVGDDGMMGVIDGDTIGLWIHGNDLDADYWVGSFEAPETDKDYSWTSTAYREMMTGLFCSSEDTKEFEYKNGEISFDFTWQGDTTHIVMKQLSEEKGLLQDVLSAAEEENEALSEVKDLVLEDYGYVLSYGYVEFAIAVTNPNEAVAPRSVNVSVVGKKADGTIRFSEDWVIGSTAPGATTYWASQAGSGDVEESDTVEITISVDDDDWFATTDLGDYYVIENTSTGPSGGYSDALKTTGEIILKEDVEREAYGDVKTPMIVCILKDAEGKIISGYSTFTTGDLSVGESKAFELESMFAAVDYATAEVYANPW